MSTAFGIVLVIVVLIEVLVENLSPVGLAKVRVRTE
jgi:hypothetical protein